MTTLFGINNCDTVRKAKKWLEAHQVDYCFHDFRADPVEKARLEKWLAHTSAGTLINRRSTTWKQLSPVLREQLSGDEVNHKNSPAQTVAIATMTEHPTLIKRPVLQKSNGEILVGFSEADYQSCL